MAIDRTAVLRKAEKLLRQGKLDAAIPEYVRVVEDQPRDWNTANALGDLYVRAGQTDKAVEQFIRIADSLGKEGFLPKAAALYKKVLKLKPDHEHALIQGAEIAATQGRLADARSYLTTVAERRRARGDTRGAAQMTIRLGTLDPADFGARSAAASARVKIGDVAGAVSDLKALAAELAEKGRQTDAFEALRQAALLTPDDDEIRERLLDLYVAAGAFAQARACAATVEQFKALAATLEAKGHPDEALEALRDAARLDPADAALKTEIARAFIARGDMTAAAEYLTAEAAGNDPHLLLTVAEMQLRAGRLDEGVTLVRRVLEQDPSRRDDIALLGWKMAEQAPEAGFQVVELVAARAVAQSDWASASAALQEFVTRVSNHIPALMHLVEICVDGGLEATMYSAQAQLADAYIAAGSGPEARFIAEDLVAREPWERANIERFRRALVLLGEPDPDSLIAERLSGQSPFTSMALADDSGDFPPLDLAPEPPAAVPPVPSESPAVTVTPRTREPLGHVELSVNAPRLDGVVGDIESPVTTTPPDAGSESVEIDLSVVLDDIKAAVAADLDGGIEKPRGDASRRWDEANEQYKRGLALRDAGRIDESIQALEAASRSPRHRFQAAALVGRMYRERGMVSQAVEWLERAAQAPAPTAGEGHQLMYELADLLESLGEFARALAICLELQADAGNYRDIAARVDRLAKVQTQG